MHESAVMPNATITFDSPGELAEAVADCRANGLPIIDYGVAHQGLGNPPPSRHVTLVDRHSLFEHYERDLSVRVSAGMTVGELRDRLRPSNQFIPLDADDDMTLREAITHNVYGPLRVGYGGVRELLLGMGFVDGNGRNVRVGGRTVKNVAGYDLTRLMVGSLGELGFIYEVVLRTYVIPETTLVVELEHTDPVGLDAVLWEWLISDAAVDQMDLVMRGRVAKLRVAFCGSVTETTSRLRSLKIFVNRTRGMTIEKAQSFSLDQGTAQRADRRAWRRAAKAVVKLIVPPASTGKICDGLAQWAGDRKLDPMAIQALPVHGCVWAGGVGGVDTVVELQQWIEQMTKREKGAWAWHARPPEDPAPKPGHASLGSFDRRAGDDVASTTVVPAFGPVQPDWSILGQIKLALDPHGVMNPNRFIPVKKVSG